MSQEPHSESTGRTDRELIESAGQEVEAISVVASTTLQLPRGAALPGCLQDEISVTSDSIAGYSILREIHRGGQGVVYEAVQLSTQRQVAIKVMREGPFAGRQDKARFEREVQVLAALKHPNIVTIHESGRAKGSFYFVMDFISGQPLDVYMAAGRCSVREKLVLFQKTCAAVNAAHLRGVIHRDLKPGNIRIDSQGEPQILDFGLAKLVQSDVGKPGAPMTMTGQFVGSLPWASPEQAEGAPDKIDIRTDVYSLGVILYQMLTGQFPYEVVGSFRQVLERITTAPPARPSTVATPRDGSIDDEIETIVLKALAKERERRYQSAGELARDIERYLAGEPIEAKRDSSWYVLKKTLRRYRLPAAAAAALIFSISAALLFSLHAWRQAVLDRDRAIRAEQAALASEGLAEQRLKQAQTASTFLQDTIASAGRSQQLTGKQVLENAISKLDGGVFKEQPEAEATIRTIVGINYLWLTHFREAETQLRIALRIKRDLFGNEHQAVGTNLTWLGLCLSNRWDWPAAESCYREALRIERDLLGNSHPRIAQILYYLGGVLVQCHRYAEAEALLLESLKIVRDSRSTEDQETRTVVAKGLSQVYLARNDLQQAATYWPSSALGELLALTRQPAAQVDTQILADLIARIHQEDPAPGAGVFGALIPFMHRCFPDRYGPAVETALERLEFTERFALMFNFIAFSPDDLQCVFACAKRIESDQLDQLGVNVLTRTGWTLVLAGECQHGAMVLREAAQRPGTPNPKARWYPVGWAELFSERPQAARHALTIAESGKDPLLPPAEPANTAAAIAAYLLGNIDEATLLQQSAHDLAWAFIAERHIMSGRIREAQAACERCIDACKDSMWQWPANLARFRLKQLDGRLPGLPHALPAESRIWEHPSTTTPSAASDRNRQ